MSGTVRILSAVFQTVGQMDRENRHSNLLYTLCPKKVDTTAE